MDEEEFRTKLSNLEDVTIEDVIHPRLGLTVRYRGREVYYLPHKLIYRSIDFTLHYKYIERIIKDAISAFKERITAFKERITSEGLDPRIVEATRREISFYCEKCKDHILNCRCKKQSITEGDYCECCGQLIVEP